MKARISEQDDQTPRPKRPSISLPEIALAIGCFLAVWLIPTRWLDTAMGAIAFSIASKVNPYLSENSIAFAADPQYFTHCHVLATWLFTPLFPYLVIRNNGGPMAFSVSYRQKIEQFGGWLPYLTLSVSFFGLMYVAMVWLVDYPLNGAERLIWISGVAPSALMFSGCLGIIAMQIYMVFFVRFSSKGKKL